MPEKFTLPRGMHDIYPLEMAERIWLYDTISWVMRKYGFQLVEPTPIENLETLEVKSGPSIKNEIYHFKDKAGRNLGLRFDLTVGMTRMITSRSDILEPIKICTISGMWRYDEPQFARYRYFYQWDAEIYGSGDSLADSEVIALSNDILTEVGLKDYELLISCRPLIEGYLKSLGIEDKSVIEKSLRIIDKMKRIPKNELIDNLNSLNISGKILDDLLYFISLKGDSKKILNKLSEFKCENESYTKGLRSLEYVIDFLEWYGKLKNCLIDTSIVRGIDYYDGIVFEAYDKGGEDVGAILGGGRYDGLGKIYGKRNIPATGVAGGMERMLLSLRRAQLIPNVSQSPRVFIAAVNDSVKKEAIKILSRLRDANIPCDTDFKNRNLRRQLEYVETIGTPYTLIIGPSELSKGKIKLRNMKKHTEEVIPLESITKYLRKK